MAFQDINTATNAALDVANATLQNTPQGANWIAYWTTIQALNVFKQVKQHSMSCKNWHRPLCGPLSPLSIACAVVNKLNAAKQLLELVKEAMEEALKVGGPWNMLLTFLTHRVSNS